MTIYEDYAGYTATYKAKYGDTTLVMIEVGSFWEIYDCDKHLGADMKAVSELLNIQVSKKNKSIATVSASNPLMAGFPSHSLQRFLPLLLEADFTVILVSQTTAPPNPERGVTHVLSRGTYVDQLDAGKSNYIMSIFDQGSGAVYGAGIIDLSTGESFYFEDIAEKLQKIISTYKPCEVLMLSDNTKTEKKKVKVSCKNYDLDPKPYLKIHYQNAVLERCFDNDSMLSIIEYIDMERKPTALVAYCALIDYCTGHNPSVVCKMKKPTDCGSSDYLDMFYNTIEQLDIEGLNKIVNKCVTAMGRRYFKKRLMFPYRSVQLMSASWDKIEAMSLEDAQAIRKVFGSVYDLERLFRRIELGTCAFSDLENVVTSVMVVAEGQDLGVWISEHVDLSKGFLRGHAEIDTLLLGLDGCRVALDRVVRRLNTIYGVDFWKVDKTERDGYYFSFTPKRWKEIVDKRDKVDASKFDVREGKVTNMTASIKVTHPALDAIFNEEERLGRELKVVSAAKYKVFLEDMVSLHGGAFTGIVSVICERDFVSTCVVNAHNFCYARPQLCKGHSCAHAAFTSVRHPIIEHVNESGEPYVGNDVQVSQNGILLYGLNASGKSSLIKAVGLNIIMAQCGMYVAASELTISPFDAVFCRISKSDNLYAGQSTFMVEMSELRKILNEATTDSLVLADELCAGTESTSAISIVSSCISSLTKKQCAFMFATHLHELTSVDIVKSAGALEIYHLDVIYDRASDLLIYNRKLCEGQGSQLYGLEVCKALDMPADFLATANEVRQEITGRGLRASKYNAKMVVDKCKLCGAGADEVHHIKEQYLANAAGFIGTMHKNKKENLVALCEKCHDDVHNGVVKIDGYKWTTRGALLLTRS